MNYPVGEGFVSHEYANEIDLCVLPEVVEVATVIGARDEVEGSVHHGDRRWAAWRFLEKNLE
jgi:hypothetical protein